MIAHAVDVTRRSLSHAAKRSKTTVFLFIVILYSTKRPETARLVSHSRQAVENDCFQKKFFLSLSKKILKMEFRCDHGEHSLQVSAKSIKGSGCGIEWVKGLK
jgi:hypothetical protein